MEQKVFLQSFSSKNSVNTSEGLNIRLKGRRKLLPTNDFGTTINQYEQYSKERENCNIIRLICQVNPICSNVLFNDITEVVKYEGSSDVSVLNYQIGSRLSDDLNGVYGKSNSVDFWSKGRMDQNDNYDTFESDNTELFTNPLRDTQLTNTKCGFTYHCGLDIMNNHLLRSQAFKTVCATKNNHDAFNTIGDMMRSVNGEDVTDDIYFPMGTLSAKEDVHYHLYQYDDIYSFSNTIKNRLISKHNGWIGFDNRSKIKSYTEFADNEDMKMERPIMYKNSGDFVDMYPDRSLYSFVPKYNEYKNRIEKNWNYCITYPSSSTTVGFEEIIETTDGLNALKAIYFDENTKSDNGVKQIVIYSIAKHGLKAGDFVNVYKTYNGENTRILNSVEVLNVVDDYIFTLASGSLQISESWVYLSEQDMTKNITVDGTQYKLDASTQHFYYTGTDTTKKYYIVNNNYVNLDESTRCISFKKVVSDVECEYYARIFSKLPNFKWASEDTSSVYQLYKDDAAVIDKYQEGKYEFESHANRLAFAKNIYSDEVGEIVFTDDIDISNIHDNLGRPLTSLYITFFKNNKGYKEWYGFDTTSWDGGKNINNNTEDNENIEFSHCFGRLMCGIECCEEAKYATSLPDIHKLKHDTFEGLNVDGINGQNRVYNENSVNYSVDNSEIISWNDKHFYGDIAYFNAYEAMEYSLQPIMHRFNTAQRESIHSMSGNYFAKFAYDEITHDDEDYGDNPYTIHTSENSYISNNKPEGYYYQASYEIPIKSFDKLQTTMPDFLSVSEIKNKTISTLAYHYLSPGDKAMVYDIDNDKYYTLVVKPSSVSNFYVFAYEAYDEKTGAHIEGDIPNFTTNNKDRFKVFKIDNLGAPSYAKLLKDGTCRYLWRDVINNGMEVNDNIETYPFTNGAFYINKSINIYVRRQDPYNVYGLYSSEDLEGNERDSITTNNYVTVSEITC